MIIDILGWAAAVFFIVAAALISAGLALLRGYNIDAHGPYKPRQLVGEILILIGLVMALPLFAPLFIVGLPVILKS